MGRRRRGIRLAYGLQMRVRHIVSTPKQIVADTGWSVADLPPRHAPIYARSRPMRAGWKWRSAACRAGEGRYTLVTLCNARRGNWQSYLLAMTTAGPSVVARFEHHASHPGLHGHADCSRGGIEVGPSGLDGLVRIPRAGMLHRRTRAWTEQTFWEASLRFFRIYGGMGEQLTLI
jgi:hypothetical protein